MQPTDKRKLIWAGSVIAVLFFGPHLLTLFRYAFLGAPPAVYRKPSPARLAPVPANRPAVIPSSALPAGINAADAAGGEGSEYLGSWTGGMTALPGRGLCKLGLNVERRSGGPADQFAGYATLTCEPMQAALAPSNHSEALALLLKGGLNPVSIALTGAPDHGAMVFRVDRIIATPPPACAMTDLTLSPFGSGQVSAVWREQSCPGGQLILRRGTR
jgi:hypothetical protein